MSGKHIPNGMGNMVMSPPVQAQYFSYLLSGDLVYLNVLGNSLLYCNSAEMAYELFERRSAIYSDRPYIPMLDLLVVPGLIIPSIA